MSVFTAAVAGKGGVGKTTFSALAVRHLHDSSKEVVLAVDADPNANLHAKLDAPLGRTIGDLREELLANVDELPAGVSKQEHVEYQIRLALTEGGGFDLLTMGRQEGAGCYCYINNILRTFIDSLSEKYAYIVMDNEAGMEHLSRRTTRSSDTLFIVSDTSKAALESASRIADLARDMDLSTYRTVLVQNLMRPDEEVAQFRSFSGFDAVYGVRRSALIQESSRSTESLMDVPATDPAFADIAKAIDEERRTTAGR
ncbi:MAG: AAA family ATPase [Thermoplasmata archaeon]|nr:AAA family ATPase [Thermoplasmata archaeon]